MDSLFIRPCRHNPLSIHSECKECFAPVNKVDEFGPFPQVVSSNGVTRHTHRFDDLNSLQDALAVLLPLANSSKVLGWMFIPYRELAGDPYPQRGYVSVQVEDRPMYLPLRDMGA